MRIHNPDILDISYDKWYGTHIFSFNSLLSIIQIRMRLCSFRTYKYLSLLVFIKVGQTGPFFICLYCIHIANKR